MTPGGRCRRPLCRSCSRPRSPARRRPPRWSSRTCELSYGELNGRANRLARLLIGRGVGPESLVAVVMERSADLVVALLAVVKAGGAYLPVDPGYPADRISYLLTDAAPVLALTDQASAAKVTGAGLPALPVLVLDDPALAAELAGLDGADVTDAERPAALVLQHPAYVIYTSGSTGRPKGVAVAHGGLASLLAAQAGVFAAGAGEPGAAVRLDRVSTRRCGSCAWRCCTGALLVRGRHAAELLDRGRAGGVRGAARCHAYARLPPAVLAVVASRRRAADGADAGVGGEALTPGSWRVALGSRGVG